MKNFTLFCLLFYAPIIALSQGLPFESAYQNHSDIPKGILEAVSWNQTHMKDIDEDKVESCNGMPRPYGVMGVFNNGADYFFENGKYIADLSKISTADQKSSPKNQIEAYAAAFETLYQEEEENLPKGEKIYNVLVKLSAIPQSGDVNFYALDSEIYDIFLTLNESDFAKDHNFSPYHFNMKAIFGDNNYKVLSAKKVFLNNGENITTENGDSYISRSLPKRATNYGPAIDDPAPSCNYSSRTEDVTAITVHDTEGSYAGAISWFKNCDSNVSAHYVIRSSDGQVTQMVDEADKAWHVGSENGYTIGLEHEGYVNQTGWYTDAMYDASAAIVKNACDTHNINRKRVAYFPWSNTTNYSHSGIPGDCVKIKGHQHFPNQTHIDPGPNWDWDYYFKLINDDTNPTVLTDESGTLYDSGGPDGNYGNDERKIWVIEPEGATEVTLDFSEFHTEDGWDYLYIYDGDNVFAPRIGIYTGVEGPGMVTSTGGSITVEFRSECAHNESGWKAEWSSDGTPEDDTPPTTDVSVDGDWHTEDFEAVFNDEDEEGGSGVEKGFYHVLYLDEGTWKANATNGFLSDNFEGSAPDSKWTSETGTWEVDDNVLKQTDETENNSNLHADLTQDLSNRYLYTWQGKITGSGDNRRAGIHFFSDNPTQSNRGNSYFVYFRVDDDEIQIHKVNDNDFVLEESVPHTIVADQWYNFKVSFDRITGEMVVIIDGEIVATWTDSDPHESGISVSFRSGNAQYEVKHFNVYRSRYPEEIISVGNDEDKDVQTQNPDPNTPAAKVKSLAMDRAGNVSGIASEFVNIDWSAPAITEINDGPDADIDTTYVNTLEGNWEAEDPHSGIDNYQVAIGTEPGEDDVLEWMDNGSETFISHLFEEIENDQVYYISVKAKNGAGLIASSESDGQRYINQDLGTKKNDLKNITLYPNPAKEKLNFQGLREATKVFIYDMNGRLVKQSLQDLNNKTLYLNDLSPGTYHVLLKVNNQVMAKKLIKK